MDNLKSFVNRVKLHGGATYSLNNGFLSEENGYMVAIKGKEQVLPESEFNDHTLATFIKNNSDILQSSNHYVGGWLNGGKVYLDVSVYYKDRYEAAKFGYENSQLAIFDIQNFKDIKLRPKGIWAYSRDMKKVDITLPVNIDGQPIYEL